jgi:hypothetical protein
VTPAEELTAAAARLKALAAAASPGPWQQSGIGDHGWTVDTPALFIAETEDSDKGRADANWIAAMHPGVGTLLAKWLGSWNGTDLDEHAAMPDDLAHALAIAREINRSQP